jgi:hypothetical protein
MGKEMRRAVDVGHLDPGDAHYNRIQNAPATSIGMLCHILLSSNYLIKVI